MSFEQLYRILRARRRLALSLYAAIIAVAVIVTLLLPKMYTAKTQVMVDLKPDPISGLTQLATMQPSGYLSTQVNLVKSDAVARRVAKDLHLADNPQMRAKWAKETHERGNFEDWMGKTLLKGLTVSVVRDSSIIEIEYESISPSFAAALANAFANAYIATVVDMRVSPAKSYTDYFDDRARLAQERAQEAQNRLVAAQKEKGVVASDERLDIETQRLAELASQLNTINALRDEASSRSTLANANPEKVQNVVMNPVVAGLTSDLAKEEARLQQLLERYGDKHPQVLEQRSTIATLKDKIRAESNRVISSVSVDTKIADARVQQAQAAYDAQRQRVMKLKDARAELAMLEKEADSAERIYEAIQLKQSQSSLESNATQSAMTVLAPAVEPPTHSSPKMWVSLILGIGLGGIATLLATLAAELMDRRIRTSVDLIQSLEIPVIGILPSPHAKRSKFKFLQRHIYGQLLPSANQLQ